MFIKLLTFISLRVSRLSSEKDKKKLTDLIIERSVELYGLTPDEISDENLKWMRDNGYINRENQRYLRGIRGRPSKKELKR